MYHFIINPNSRSGQGIKTWHIVEDKLKQQNIKYISHFTEYNKHATMIVRELTALASDFIHIIVLGGDGTLNEVINGIEDLSKVFLGYIPTGSSNDFARSLKIPRDPLLALENILKPNYIRTFDYGRIEILNSNTITHFSCSSGIGFDANVCREALNSKIKDTLNRFGFGKLTYLMIALKQLIQSDFFDAEVIIDGHKKSYHQIFFISSLVHKYAGGGLKIAPKAVPNDGMIDVCLVHGLSRLKIFFMIPTLLIGKHIHFKGVEYFQCKNIDIKTSKKMCYHTDGEVSYPADTYRISCIPLGINLK